MSASKNFNQPLGANDMPRFGGIPSMMRLPVSTDLTDVDVCFVGIPMDIGASNRAGTRHGPRQIRTESCLIRPYNMGTGAAPFESFQVVDYGDLAINTFNLKATCDIITKGVNEILDSNTKPLILGGDHTLTYPVLRSFAKKHGPVALVHVDAHADTSEAMFGEKVAHGTPFRRAVEEKLIIPEKTFQIGLRGSGYSPDDYNWGRAKGFEVYTAEMCWHKSLKPLMDDIRQKVGQTPVYLSFDIDSMDPAFAPGTGTVELGGLTTIQGLEVVRGCLGMNLAGGDLVEVSPPYDTTGNTALIGAQLLFEMLCVVPGIKMQLDFN
ncbi:MAG: agmatinase [Rhodobacteraceae bacterium]|nr:agmatinase [Paracoccaceae bacterium]MCY4249414.1 agmatinase [Paracoccaceae bacterium]